MDLPLTRDQVDVTHPFSPEELLYRRIPLELNSMGEIVPTLVSGISFKSEVQTSPSVNRSAFSSPEDVLDSQCANNKDVSNWLVYFLRVDNLPRGLVAGDNRVFDFVPRHIPLESCGCHSVIASVLRTDHTVYEKPSQAVINAFKVKFALALSPIDRTYDWRTQTPII